MGIQVQNMKEISQSLLNFYSISPSASLSLSTAISFLLPSGR